jgi:hypothetical protein
MIITACSPLFHEEVKTWNRWEALQLLFNPQIKTKKPPKVYNKRLELQRNTAVDIQ